jgi:hypothetical protein
MPGWLKARLEKIHRSGKPIFHADVFLLNKNSLKGNGLEKTRGFATNKPAAPNRGSAQADGGRIFTKSPLSRIYETTDSVKTECHFSKKASFTNR